VRKLHVLLAAATSVAAIATTGPAYAAGSPKPIKAVTHTSDHPDTTSVAGACTDESDNGPVWAYDDLSLQLVSTSNGDGTYAVTVTAHGSFNAMSDPTTGECWSGHGSVDGWINYTVTSTVAPDKSNLPAQEPGSMKQSEIIAQFFGGQASSVVGGSYHYTYNRVNGSRYTQDG
jgi:hypothetical protein